MAQLGKFQSREFTSWKGLTKENHLASVFELEPQKATDVWIEILAQKRGVSLEGLLNKLPVKVFDDDSEMVWNVIASSRRNIPLIEARKEDGTAIGSDNVGVGGKPFYLVFGEDWFADGNVIVGQKNEIYPVRILGNPRMEGTNAVYKVELMGGVMSGIPAEELAFGTRWSVDFSPVEKELSREVGDVRYSAPIGMRNEFSMIRIQHKVPGNMLNKKVAIGIPYKATGSNKVTVVPKWVHHVEYKVEETFSEEKNNLIVFGRSNRNKNGEYANYGKSGNVIKQGAGLREQMEYSNVIYYNDTSEILSILENALYDLSSGRLDLSDRTFVVRTGERGAAAFSKAVQEQVSGWTAFVLNADGVGMVQNVQSNLHKTALAAGFQFTEFRAPNGVTVKVEVDPMYDDEVRNKIMHPNGGPAESYRFDIMDIGTMEIPNIQLAKVKDGEARGYQWGLRNPFTGQLNNFNMSYSEDSAVIHRMWEGGVIVFDPSRTLSIIPAILA